MAFTLASIARQLPWHGVRSLSVNLSHSCENRGRNAPASRLRRFDSSSIRSYFNQNQKYDQTKPRTPVNKQGDWENMRGFKITENTHNDTKSKPNDFWWTLDYVDFSTLQTKNQKNLKKSWVAVMRSANNHYPHFIFFIRIYPFLNVVICVQRKKPN